MDDTATLESGGSTPKSSAPEEGRFAAGSTIGGRYRILGLLGRGGMGEVYKAFDVILNQTVALKFLIASRFGVDALIRFRNEVRVARQVSHPNVCRVYDLGVVDGLNFLSMEYIDGEDLASLLRRIGRLPQDKAVEFTRKICAGLGAAHDRGVLHRDLKPANIMIDGRGQVRITDFGLAALAEEIPLSDLRSGTPAYMAPEQKAGREVTPRSDIYSLGLVLHEMFTGRQRKAAGSQPTEIVKDLDPAIDRLILRCLEEDPSQRPPTALRVAMGLPGGDPVAAALAAGETPSPEMVAASQEKEGFRARTALLCFAAALLSLVGGIALSDRFGLSARVPMPLAPDVLADRSRQLLESIGYTETPADSTWGLVCCDRARLDALSQLGPAEQDARLRSHQPPVAYFWYRQHRSRFESADGPYQRPTETSPPNYAPGMIQVQLDPKGRLLRLQVQPWDRSLAPATLNWPELFGKAGLEYSRFRPTAPVSIPAMATDEQLAWEGSYAGRDAERITVEAASWRGRPVFFEAAAANPPPSSRTIRFVVFLVLAAVTALAAWRQVHSGRWDRRGAAVVTIAVLSLALLAGAGLVSFYYAALGLALYAGVEPSARRYWPDSLISWSRLCRGQLSNPLVASHVLAAIAGAAFVVYVFEPAVEYLVANLPMSSAHYDALAGAGSPRVFLSGLIGGVLAALVYLAIVVLTRLGLAGLGARKTIVADLIASAAFNFLAIGLIFTGTLEQRIIVGAALMLPSLAWIAMMRHFGFLSVMTVWIFQQATISTPVTATGWLASSSLALHSIPVLVAAWATWIVVSSERRIPREEF